MYNFRCDDGYFGAPKVPGKRCEPCNCAGNPCDRRTGQCLACKGNTEGLFNFIINTMLTQHLQVYGN